MSELETSFRTDYLDLMKACDWPFKTVEIQCDHCNQSRSFSKATFVELVGADTELSTARRTISSGCPAWKANPDHISLIYNSPARASRFEMISSWTFLPPVFAIV